MDTKLTMAEDVFLDKVNQICGKFGLNDMMAQLYAVLYFSNKPMSLDDMVERLRISKGSASVNIRALERYGVVRKVWVRGSRRDFYEAEMDIAKVVIARIRAMAQNRLSEVDDMLSSSYKSLDGLNRESSEDTEDIRLFKQKLDKLKDLYTQAKSVFGLLDSNLLMSAFDNNSKKDIGDRGEDEAKESLSQTSLKEAQV